MKKNSQAKSTHYRPTVENLVVRVQNLLNKCACLLHQYTSCRSCFAQRRSISSIRMLQEPMACLSDCNAPSLAGPWQPRVAIRSEEFCTKCTEDPACCSWFVPCVPHYFSAGQRRNTHERKKYINSPYSRDKLYTYVKRTSHLSYIK